MFETRYNAIARVNLARAGPAASPVRTAVQPGEHQAAGRRRLDFYAMDCYRQLAEDKMAGHLAEEVLRASTDFDGAERAPMRKPRPGSPSASSPPAKATSDKPSTTASGH